MTFLPVPLRVVPFAVFAMCSRAAFVTMPMTLFGAWLASGTFVTMPMTLFGAWLASGTFVTMPVFVRARALIFA